MGLQQRMGFSFCVFWWGCDWRNHLNSRKLVSTTGVILPSLRGVSEDKLAKPWKMFRCCVVGKGCGYLTGTCSSDGKSGLGWARARPSALSDTSRVHSVCYRAWKLRRERSLLPGDCHAKMPGQPWRAFLLSFVTWGGLPAGPDALWSWCALPGKTPLLGTTWQDSSKVCSQRSQTPNLRLE